MCWNRAVMLDYMQASCASPVQRGNVGGYYPICIQPATVAGEKNRHGVKTRDGFTLSNHSFQCQHDLCPFCEPIWNPV